MLNYLKMLFLMSLIIFLSGLNDISEYSSTIRCCHKCFIGRYWITCYHRMFLWPLSDMMLFVCVFEVLKQEDNMFPYNICDGKPEAIDS